MSPTPSHTKLVGDIKEPTSHVPYSTKSRVGDIVPGVVVLSHGLGGRRMGS